MPRHRYQAIDGGGGLCRGTSLAFNEADLEARLRREGLTLVKSRPVRERKGAAGRLGGGKVNVRLLIEFYHRFSQTLSMGLPVLTGLDENAKVIPSKPLKRVLEEMRVALEDGKTLHDAMSQFPSVFTKLDLGIISMGEQSGVLPECLDSLAEFLEWKEGIRSMIKRATIYPCFIMVTIVAVIGVWVGYVLPQLATMLSDMGVTLPPFTLGILATSQFLETNWAWMLLGIVVSVVLFSLSQKTEKGKYVFHKYILRVPVIGNVVNNIAIARLSQNFATMHRSGITINKIFEILTDNVIGNRYLESQTAKAYQELQAGQSLSESFEKVGGFPPLLLGSIRHGETTGKLDDAFKRLGDFFDGEVKRTVQIMVDSMEPLTLFVLGGVFAVIILSIFLPLYDVVGGFMQSY